jgi:hypothetical protein
VLSLSDKSKTVLPVLGPITSYGQRSHLMSVCPCIIDNMKRESQLNATQWFIELMIRATCFGHYYDHHQELEIIQMFTACGT